MCAGCQWAALLVVHLKDHCNNSIQLIVSALSDAFCGLSESMNRWGLDHRTFCCSGFLGRLFAFCWRCCPSWLPSFCLVCTWCWWYRWHWLQEAFGAALCFPGILGDLVAIRPTAGCHPSVDLHRAVTHNKRYLEPICAEPVLDIAY